MSEIPDDGFCYAYKFRRKPDGPFVFGHWPVVDVHSSPPKWRPDTLGSTCDGQWVPVKLVEVETTDDQSSGQACT